MMDIEEEYERRCEEKSDIAEHLPILRELASECGHVTEFGVRHGNSTVAFLAANPPVLHSYDIREPPEELLEIAQASKTDFRFFQRNALKTEIEPTDLLFIDTIHNAEQLRGELDRHAAKSRRYIVLHDTDTYGFRGQDGGQGLILAIGEFLNVNENWVVSMHFHCNNGLTVLQRGDSWSSQKGFAGFAQQFGVFTEKQHKRLAEWDLL